MVKDGKDPKGSALIGLSLKRRYPLALILAFGAIVFFADTATAKRISLRDGQKVIRNCTGFTWGTGPTTATTGCVMSDGSGVVCGGVTGQQQQSCDTFRVRRADLRSMAARGTKRSPD